MHNCVTETLTYVKYFPVEADYQTEPVGVKSTPVGPVAGGIMGCFLLLALGVYCYRHHVHRHSHHYISTLPDNTNRISHYYNDEDQEAAEDVSAGECKFLTVILACIYLCVCALFTLVQSCPCASFSCDYSATI